ncbi:putative ABC transporter ATP-binding protein [Clostridia bacterium]|nr:putative ABC transporter ATP-binding protein [Clostridia bacterium]
MFTIIGTHDLFVKYDKSDDEYALLGVSLEVGGGEKVALIGANGAGKSTLLLTLAGVLTKSSGEIISADVGMIFQNPDDQLFLPRVYDDIAFGLRNTNIDESSVKESVEAAAERLSITHLLTKYTHKLSGGEKRLAALAGILVMNPDAILADEPSSYLDPRSRRRLIEILNSLDKTMLIATHDLGFARAVCPRSVILSHGVIAADGETNAILEDEALLETCGL